MPKAKPKPTPREMTVGESIAEAIDQMIQAQISIVKGKSELDGWMDYVKAKRMLASVIDSIPVPKPDLLPAAVDGD